MLKQLYQYHFEPEELEKDDVVVGRRRLWTESVTEDDLAGMQATVRRFQKLRGVFKTAHLVSAASTPNPEECRRTVF